MASRRADMLNGFYNPPSGGNARGVAIESQFTDMGRSREPDGTGGDGWVPNDRGSTTGAGSQPGYKEQFMSGFGSASRQQNTSSAASVPDMRNFTRTQLVEPAKTQYPDTMYGEHAAIEGDGYPNTGIPPVPTPMARNDGRSGTSVVTPRYQPQMGSLGRVTKR